jgi:hypothetical protein
VCWLPLARRVEGALERMKLMREKGGASSHLATHGLNLMPTGLYNETKPLWRPNSKPPPKLHLQRYPGAPSEAMFDLLVPSGGGSGSRKKSKKKKVGSGNSKKKSSEKKSGSNKKKSPKKQAIKTPPVGSPLKILPASKSRHTEGTFLSPSSKGDQWKLQLPNGKTTYQLIEHLKLVSSSPSGEKTYEQSEEEFSEEEEEEGTVSPLSKQMEGLSLPDPDEQALSRWLSSNGLTRYSQTLIDGGCSSLDILQDVEDEELEGLGVPKMARRTILKKAMALKDASGAMSTGTAYTTPEPKKKKSSAKSSEKKSSSRGPYKKSPQFLAKAAAKALQEAADAKASQELFDKWYTNHCNYSVQEPKIRIICTHLRKNKTNSYKQYCERNNQPFLDKKGFDAAIKEKCGSVPVQGGISGNDWRFEHLELK